MAGRPLKFKTPELMLKKANKYFASLKEEEWTITGLAVFLDTSRETLVNYQKKDAYFDTVKGLKDKVEAAYEKTLRKRGNAGDIFGLKNFGWSDRHETDITSGGKPIPILSNVLINDGDKKDSGSHEAD